MLTDVLLPLALAVIMFALGLGLTLADFTQVLQRPRTLVAGLVSQMLLLPLIAFLIAVGLGLSAEMAVGLMLIAACPGGASAGLITKLAGGETALSIALTALTSLLAVLTVPLVVDLSLQHFTGSGVGVELPVFGIVKGVFLISTVPVALGMWLRHRFPAEIVRLEPRARRLVTALFILIVIATFIGQRQALFDHFGSAGPAALALCVLTMLSGHLLGRTVRINRPGRIAITVECGLQNAGLAIFLALTVLQHPALAVPGVIYALLMNVCALAFIALMRRGHRPA